MAANDYFSTRPASLRLDDPRDRDRFQDQNQGWHHDQYQRPHHYDNRQPSYVQDPYHSDSPFITPQPSREHTYPAVGYGSATPAPSYHTEPAPFDSRRSFQSAHSRPSNPWSDEESVGAAKSSTALNPASTSTTKLDTNQASWPPRSTNSPYPISPDQRQPPVEYQRRRKRRSKKKQGFFSGPIPWVVYTLTLVQLSVFIFEIVKNSIVTGSPIMIKPQFNPMIGPSTYVIINSGARFVPCMRTTPGVQNATTPVYWPCPNTTTTDTSSPSNQCTLAQLCGLSGLDFENPNQWYRFIVPIFLHAGIIHIGFNMLLQMTMGREMERLIGSVRFALVYFSSGIFGFVMGGNFAAPAIASTGASGCLFGILALVLLDLLYSWQDRDRPVQDLMWILCDVVISFVLGLLPGLDNFSHIGGFLMGLVLGVCILHSPAALRQRIGASRRGDDDPYSSTGASDIALSPVSSTSSQNALKPGGPDRRSKMMATATTTTVEEQKRKHRASTKVKPIKPTQSSEFFKHPVAFFQGRKPLWWTWWLLRVGALIGVLVSFVVLLNNFYEYRDTCGWCKYLSCLPINGWCNIGNLTLKTTSTSGNKKRMVEEVLEGIRRAI